MVSNAQRDFRSPITAAPTLSRRAAKRARLARLREEAEPVVAEERRTALRALLQHPLLVPDGVTALAFALVRKHRSWLTDWFAHHADWSLVATAEAVRLRKHPPDNADGTRGAVDQRSEELFTRTRYVLLCLALAALERGDRHVTLARLSEAIILALASDAVLGAAGIHWTLDQQSGRRDLVHVLRWLVESGVLRRVQGDEERLMQDRQTDVLYYVSRPVLTLLLAAQRSPSLQVGADFPILLEALAGSLRPDTPDARNRAMRTFLVRRLLDDPVLYYDSLDEEQREYLDRQRGSLLTELAEATGLHPEVRAEGLALTDLEGDCTDFGLPDEGTEGHLTLLLAAWLADRLRDGDGSAVSMDMMCERTDRLIEEHRHHWRREVNEKGAANWLTERVVTLLAGLDLVTRNGDLLTPRPAIGRFAVRTAQETQAQPIPS